MPRSMWKGVVSFGMVSIPIRLYNATESTAKVSFRQLCPDHHSPISYKRWCAEGDHEVQYSEILRGYEVGKDRYVIIDDKDLDNLPLPTAHAIDIEEFVPVDDVEPGLYYDSVMNTLHWPDEIRSTEGLKGLEDEVKINPKELEMAKALIESLADSFDPSRYKDNYREAVMKVVRAKAEGEVIEAPEAPQPAKVMDLMEALRQSVAQAKKQRAGREKPAAETKRRRKAS
ncbi:MAG: hypothetical protein E6I35_10275 [Chloroflexi bacterium]|nr:MAG: hypothetical protein E6I35_10275 [Chloroflexota bacterium]